MVPRDKKEKQAPNELPNIKKRRNSLADSSASSASSSSASSSTGSGTDSDGASTTESGCDSKGTMTSPPIDLEAGLGANSNGFFDSGNMSSLGYEQRPIRKESPTQHQNKFRSIADDFPNELEMSSQSTTRSFILSPSGDVEKAKDKKKSGKPGNKKKREKKKKDKTEEEIRGRQHGKTSPPYKTYDLEQLRDIVEFSKVKEQLNSQYIYNSGATPNEVNYASSSQTFVDPSHIKHCGIGISATGYYDKIPRIIGHRTSDRKYSELYTEIDYVKDLEQHLRNENSVDKIKSESNFLTDLFSKMGGLISSIDNGWIRNLLYLVTSGKVNKVWRRINVIERTLREMPGNHPYSLMHRQELLEIITKGLVDLLNDPTDNTNVFMYLSSTFLCDKTCNKLRHGRCMTLDLLLSLLPPIERHRVLSKETFNHGRRAIHFAAVSGQTCQLDVLLKYDVDPNVFDSARRAPIHYIRQRNNVMMLRSLMWHGADMSLVEPGVGNVPYSIVSTEIQDFQFWMMTRMTALERSLLSWVKSIIGNLYSINDNPVTHLHQCRLASDGDSTPCTFEMADGKSESYRSGIVVRDFELAVKNNDPRSPDEHVLLVALPVSYSIMDIGTPADHPHIVRSKLCTKKGNKEQPIVLFTEPPVVHCSRGPDCSLISAVNEEHNGHIYVYKVNKELKPSGRDHLRLTIDTNSLGKRAHYIHLLVQAFVCRSKQTKAKIE